MRALLLLWHHGRLHKLHPTPPPLWIDNRCRRRHWASRCSWARTANLDGAHNLQCVLAVHNASVRCLRRRRLSRPLQDHRRCPRHWHYRPYRSHHERLASSHQESRRRHGPLHHWYHPHGTRNRRFQAQHQPSDRRAARPGPHDCQETSHGRDGHCRPQRHGQPSLPLLLHVHQHWRSRWPDRHGLLRVLRRLLAVLHPAHPHAVPLSPGHALGSQTLQARGPRGLRPGQGHEAALGCLQGPLVHQPCPDVEEHALRGLLGERQALQDGPRCEAQVDDL